jgi:hypothetical protein
MPAVGDLVELQIRGLLLGQQFENTLGFKARTTAGTFAALAADFWSAAGASYMASKSNDFQVNEIAVVAVYPDTAATASYTTGLPDVGANAGDTLPPQLAQVVSFNTALKGRSYRGRNYIGGWTEANQTDGYWNGDVTTATSTYFSDVSAVFGVGGTDPDWEWVVISRFLDGGPRANPIGTAVVSYIVRETVNTMRRRAIGHGS